MGNFLITLSALVLTVRASNDNQRVIGGALLTASLNRIFQKGGL